MATEEQIEAAAIGAWLEYLRPHNGTLDDLTYCDEDYTETHRQMGLRHWAEDYVSIHIGRDGLRACAKAALEAVGL